jgi:hypothetical protein
MSMHADFGLDDTDRPEWEGDEEDWGYRLEEETAQEARERMTPGELEADLAFDPFAEA